MAAAIVGALGTGAEAFIGVVTLLSGFNFGWFDVIGTGLGLAAFVLVWRQPRLASLFWLATLPCLYAGHMLVLLACLPVMALSVIAAALAFWSALLPHRL